MEVEPLLATILVGSASYVGGLLTRPFEQWIKNRTDRSKLRRSLYAEMRMNSSHSLMFRVGFSERQKHEFSYPGVEKWERREVYDQALKQQPMLFYGIPEATEISEFYLALSEAKTASPDKQVQLLLKIQEWVTDSIKAGKLSWRLMKTRHPVFVWLDTEHHKLASRNLGKMQKAGRCA